MADRPELDRAPAMASQAEASRRADSGERHEALEARPEVEAELDHRALLNGRPALAAQRRAAARLAGRPAGPRPVQRAAAPNRTGLPDRLKAGVEALSGVSLGGVKVHYNSAKPAGLDAHAFTQGSDIHLAPGQERHLPHEAWHVAQQAQGRVRATAQLTGIAINDQPALEAEADRMGALAARGPAGGGPRPAPDRAAAPARGAPAQLAKGDGIAIVRNTALRATRSATGKSVTVIKTGTAAEELEGRTAKWVRLSITVPEETIAGWVPASDAEPAEEGEELIREIGGEITITKATAIRAQRSPKGKELAPLKAAATVKLLDSTAKWLRVELIRPEHRLPGWVPVDDTALQPRVVDHKGATIEDAPRNYTRLNRKPFEGEPSGADVKQGGLGDCWLLAPLAAIADTAEGKKSIKAMIHPHEAAAEYEVRFFVPSAKDSDEVSERTVTVDNHFAGAREDQIDFAQPLAKKGIWPLIVEKGAADVEGGYDEIEGGYVSRAYLYVTGKRPRALGFRVTERNEDTTEEKTPENLREIIAQAHAEDKAISVSIPPQEAQHQCPVLVAANGDAGIVVPDTGIITSSIRVTFMTANGQKTFQGIDGTLTCSSDLSPALIEIRRAHFVAATSPADVTYKYTNIGELPGGHVYKLLELDGDDAILVNPHDTSKSVRIPFEELDEDYDASFFVGDTKLG